MAKSVKIKLSRSLLSTVLGIAAEQYKKDMEASKEHPRIVASFEGSLRTVESLRSDVEEETVDLIELVD